MEWALTQEFTGTTSFYKKRIYFYFFLLESNNLPLEVEQTLIQKGSFFPPISVNVCVFKTLK